MLRILTPATGLLVAAALLAGCGGSNKSGNGGSSTVSSSSRHANDGLKMAQCMRANGVPSFPDPPSNRAGGIAISPGANGTVNVNGAAAFTAGGFISVNNANNALPSVSFNAGADVSVQSANAMAIGTSSITGSGILTVTAGGNIT